MGRPTPAEIAAASNQTLPDVLAPDLGVVFVGINPSLYSAATGHHFGRPGNRFWPALHGAGFTPWRVDAGADRTVLELGLGLTNLVARATARADELTPRELGAGARTLERKVRRLRPRWVAIVGITAYRTAFRRPRAVIGPQPERIVDAALWALPNPSGLNAHYSLEALTRCFAEFRRAVAGDASPRSAR